MRRRGFTLLEMAIVLVIIGFLIAMGIKGTELIKSASLQKEAYKFKKIAAAIGTFYNKYNKLPYDGWGGKYSQTAGRYVRPPQDGVIQFWESGGAKYLLRFWGDALLDEGDMTIIETPWFFSSAGYVRLDHENGNDWWVSVYYFDPGIVWNNENADVTESTDFGTGPFTAIVLAQYDTKRIYVKEDTRSDEQKENNEGECDKDCSDGLCDMNGDGDCTDNFGYNLPYNVRSGPADARVSALDGKVDNRNSWDADGLRSALRYDMKEDAFYRLNEKLNDSDGDKRPEVGYKAAYGNNTRNRNFVAYKIW